MRWNVLNQILIHDLTVSITLHLIDIIENLVRPEERLDVAREFHRVLVAGLETYEEMRERLEKCLKPSLN